MNINFAIITTIKERSTLKVMLESFYDTFGYDVDIHSNDKGVMSAWLTAARKLIDTDKPYCCVLSDDYIFHVDTLEYLSDAPDTFGYLALSTPKQPGLQDYLIKDGWNDINIGRGAWGGNYVIATDLMIEMLNSELFAELTDGKTKGVDSCVSEWMYRTGNIMYYHNPSVTLHIGIKSTLDHGFVQSYGWHDLEL